MPSIRFTALLFLGFASFSVAKPPADLQSRLDTFVKLQPGGAAVAWVDADGTAFFTAGKLSASDSHPITPDTPFEIGSVSKLFTALLLAETELKGKVSRSDPAAKYLLGPGDPAQASLARITLFSLTTHTSGLPRMPANMATGTPEALANPYAHYERSELVEALRLQGPNATPDRAMAYSNFGVSVLGEALGAAWGTSYTEALQTHVLDPLNLKATSVGLTGEPPPSGLAPAHVQGKIVPSWTWQACAAAGGLRSTARDLSRFLTAYLGTIDTPLHDAIEATLQPQHSADDTGGEIALGWLLTDDVDCPLAWHNGATAGTHAFIGFSRKTGEGLVILANFQKASESLGFSLLGVKPPQPVIAAVKDATRYTGRYPLSPAFAIDITEVKGALFAQATGQSRLTLRQLDVNRFSVVGVPAEISFERDPAGKITALTLHQNGQDQRGPRQDLPAPLKEQTTSVELLHEYVGTYPLAPSFEVVVTEENGALFVQATGQAKFPVFASAKDEFFYKVVDAQISFQRDAAGKVDGLVLHQGGNHLPGKKTEK